MTTQPSEEYLDGLFEGQSLIISDAIHNMLDITKDDLPKVLNKLIDHLYVLCLHAVTVTDDLAVLEQCQKIIAQINEYKKEVKE